MSVANRLYYNYAKGKVNFENNYFTYRNPKESPYNTAEKLG